MLDPIVRVETRQASGSGTIYEKIETETENVFEYRILTNQHVTRTRMIFSSGADFLIGKLFTFPIDTGCSVDVFDHKNHEHKEYVVKVVAENAYLDLAILSFETDNQIAVALLATDEMLASIRVFDNVFAVGCQLGMRPTPTFGIISEIISGVNEKLEWMLYGTTSQISPGSSGGGLFREYDGHYYLIGIPFRVAVTWDRQIMPHLANAIALSTARDFLDENKVSKE
jgi:S1-C subfamily serine protease